MYLSRKQARPEPKGPSGGTKRSDANQAGGSGLPLGSHSVVGSDVDGVGGGVVANGQTQVRDAASPVFLHEDVLGLQVSVSYGRFAWRQTITCSTVTTDPAVADRSPGNTSRAFSEAF